MKIKMLNLAIAGLVLALSSFANAGVITYNGYTLDQETDIVTGGGLEWLQWDVTIGQSINSALAADGIFNGRDYGSGWTLASNAQMAGLFDNFTFSSTEDENDNARTQWNTQTHSVFHQMLGITSSGDYVNASPTTWLHYTGAVALYGSDHDGDDLYNLAHVHRDLNVLNGSSSYWSEMSADYYTRSSSFQTAGVALVRTEALARQVNAPEPSTLAIFALGLSGLIFRRHRQVLRA